MILFREVEVTSKILPAQQHVLMILVETNAEAIQDCINETTAGLDVTTIPRNAQRRI
jgi:hypothetical protein